MSISPHRISLTLICIGSMLGCAGVPQRQDDEARVIESTAKADLAPAEVDRLYRTHFLEASSRSLASASTWSKLIREVASELRKTFDEVSAAFDHVKAFTDKSKLKEIENYLLDAKGGSRQAFQAFLGRVMAKLGVNQNLAGLGRLTTKLKDKVTVVRRRGSLTPAVRKAFVSNYDLISRSTNLSDEARVTSLSLLQDLHDQDEIIRVLGESPENFRVLDDAVQDTARVQNANPKTIQSSCGGCLSQWAALASYQRIMAHVTRSLSLPRFVRVERASPNRAFASDSLVNDKEMGKALLDGFKAEFEGESAKQILSGRLCPLIARGVFGAELFAGRCRSE